MRSARVFSGAGRVRSSIRGPEWVVIVFLIYASSLAVLLPVSPHVVNRVLVLNSIAIGIYGVLVRFNHSLTVDIIRDWLLLGMILFAYREMGWFAMSSQSHTLEASWVAWDRLFLRGGAKAVIEFLGPVLPSLLEVSYSLVYTLAPASVAVLYLYRRRDRVDRFLLVFAIGVLLCYAQFPFWPSEPPRVVFFGQDLPVTETIFRRFNLWLLGNYGIHTSVFPSAHVAAAFSTAFGMGRALPERKWVSRLLFGTALLIALATVYGRYHYLADVVAGFSMAVVAWTLCALLQRKPRQSPDLLCVWQASGGSIRERCR